MLFPYNKLAGRSVNHGMIQCVNHPALCQYLVGKAMSLHFKPNIDWSCVAVLAKSVRDGSLLENRTVNLDHALWLAGSVNAYIAEHKEPGVFGSISVPNELEGEDNLLLRLKEEVPNLFEDKPAMGATAPGEKKLNPVVAAYLKKLLALALEQLLK